MDVLDHQRTTIAYLIDGVIDRSIVEPTQESLEKADLIIHLLRNVLASYKNEYGYPIFLEK